MALLFNAAKRQNPTDPDSPFKWYVVLKSLGMMSEREVALAISDETTLNPKEAEMALYQLQKVMINALLDGKTVQLGELGSFRLTVNSDGVDTEDEVTAMQVKKVNLRFVPSTRIKEQIAKATFKPAKNLSSSNG